MARIAKRLVKIEKRIYITFKQQLAWILSTAFAIAAAIAWKDAIALSVQRFIPNAGELAYSTYAALIITAVGVVVIWVSAEFSRNK